MLRLCIFSFSIDDDIVADILRWFNVTDQFPDVCPERCDVPG